MCACLPASVLLQLGREQCARDKAVALRLQKRRADVARRCGAQSNRWPDQGLQPLALSATSADACMYSMSGRACKM
jgi:hypothetical protein